MSLLPDKCTCIPNPVKQLDEDWLEFLDIPDKTVNVFCPIHGDFKSPVTKIKERIAEEKPRLTIWQKILGKRN